MNTTTKQWLISILTGTALAMISLLVIILEVHFPPPYKDIFEVVIILSTVLIPHWMVTKKELPMPSFWRLSLLGWVSFTIYLLYIFLYFMLLSSGSFSGDLTIVIIALGGAFVISSLSATFFRWKRDRTKA